MPTALTPVPGYLMVATYPTRRSRPFGFCALLRIDGSRREELARLLERARTETIATMERMGRAFATSSAAAPPAQPSLLPFERLPELHFARCVQIPAAEGSDRAGWLAIATDFNGPAGASARAEREIRREHLLRLVQEAEPGLRALLACCEGFDPDASRADLVELLDRHHHPASTLYCGSRGRSREQIELEAHLRRRVDAWLDARRAQGGALPAAPVLMEELRRAIGAVPAFPTTRSLSLLQVAFLAIAILLAVLTPLFWISWKLGLGLLLALVLLLLVGYVILRRKEASDPCDAPIYSQAEREHVREASIDEDRFFPNALTHLVDVKPGRFRSFLLDAVFGALRVLVVTTYNRGRLGDIPSIHYARWLRFDGRRRLLFFSNFDSSWESYLGDFIDQAAIGLTGVWSNTAGYPRTRNLLFGGATQGNAFKAWARHHQVRTHVWYAAYPGLSILNINENTQLRQSLAEPTASDASILSKLI